MLLVFLLLMSLHLHFTMHIYYCNTLTCESGCRQENNIKIAVKEVDCEWINLAYDRCQWWAVVGRMLNVLILLNSRQWFYWLRDCAEWS